MFTTTCGFYTVTSRCTGFIQVMFTPTETSSIPPPQNTHAYPSPAPNKMFTPHTPGTKGQADLYPPHSQSELCSGFSFGCSYFMIYLKVSFFLTIALIPRKRECLQSKCKTIMFCILCMKDYVCIYYRNTHLYWYVFGLT